MAVQWNVYSGSEVFGPWSASRVRDELRAGRIDAFDLVSAVGSSVKRSLVEVDEIFESSRVQAAAVVSDFSDALPDEVSLKNPLKKPMAEAMSLEAPQQMVSGDRPRVFEALASPERVQAPSSRNQAYPGAGGAQRGHDSGKLSRRSYLLLLPDSGPRGPFSSRDVLMLWYAKKLSPRTQIQRVGDSKRVEVGRFAAFYERAAPSGMAFIGQASLVGSAKDRSLYWLIGAILAALVILTTAFYWRANRVAGALVMPSTIGASVVSPDDESDFGDAGDEAEVNDTPVNAMPDKVAPAQGKSTIRDIRKPSGSVPSGVRAPAIKRVIGSSPKANQKVPVKAPKIPVKPRRSSPNLLAAPSVAKPMPIKAPEARTRTSPQQPATAWTDGAVVTLSGYSFNVALLNACDTKCKIPMRGPKGPVTAVFFKEAFASGLAAKAARVTITGSIRKDPASGSISIFVQSFR